MDIEKLLEKAAALGCSFQRGPKKYSGYILIDSNGDMPLGGDYTASLADIQKYLDDITKDDIELGSETPTKAPSKKEISKALAKHSEAAQIKGIIDSKPDQAPKLTEAEKLAQRRREGTIDAGGSLYWTAGQLKAAEIVGLSGGMAPEDYARVKANAHQAKIEQDKIEAANNDPMADAAFNEMVRRNNVFQKANRQLNSTNISSRGDINIDEYWDNFCRTLLPIEIEDDCEPSSDAPAGVQKASIGLTIQTMRQARQRDHGAVDADAFASIKRGADERRLAEAGPKIDAAAAAGDYAAAGSILADVKRIIGHGNFISWLERNGIHRRTAQRWLRAAKSDTTASKSDTK